MHIDFETRSTVDLKKRGVYNYAQPEHTEVLCMSYASSGGKVYRWVPGDPFPFNTAKFGKELTSAPFYAWNAGFERLIWNNVCTKLYGWPQLPVEMFRCVAYAARRHALPGKLENAARCLNLSQQKDMAGNRLMKKLCSPQTTPIPPYTAVPTDELDGFAAFHQPTNEEFEQLQAYCDQDVIVEREIFNLLRPLADKEWSDYHVCEHINDRGVSVDVEFAKKAITYAEEEKRHFKKQIVDLTAGTVSSPQSYAALGKWYQAQLSPNALKLCERDGKLTFDKASRAALLEAENEGGISLDTRVRDVIDICNEAGKASISKYQAVVNRSSMDGRLRGVYLASGAGQTNRYSSIAVQLHNLVRFVPKDAPAIIHSFKTGEHVDDPISKLSTLVRPTLQAAPGKVLVWADWSAIEARSLPWLMRHEETAQAKLDLFEKGVDVYVKNQEAWGLKTRQEGKVGELAFGYGGGVGAGQNMARAYGLKLSDDHVDFMKTSWRLDNPWAPKLWDGLENAAISAVLEPHRAFDFAGCAYLCMPNALNGLGALYCKLPCGTYLTYPNPRVTKEVNWWGQDQLTLSAIKGNFTPKVGAQYWPRVRLWKGLTTENVNQAICATLLRGKLRMINAVLHTHDEIVVEVDEDVVDSAVYLLHRHMTSAPTWMKGCPLAVEVETGTRYKVKS